MKKTVKSQVLKKDKVLSVKLAHSLMSANDLKTMQERSQSTIYALQKTIADVVFIVDKMKCLSGSAMPCDCQVCILKENVKMIVEK